MSLKLIKNRRLTIDWCSLLFILIFSRPTIVGGDQQANASLTNQSGYQTNAALDRTVDSTLYNDRDQFEYRPNDQRSGDQIEPASRPVDVKIRKQRNSFMNKELTHQNHHFHNKYYSSIQSNSYRSSAANSIYLNEQPSDAYVAYRSLHNHSLLTSTDSLGFLSGSLTSSNLQQQQQTSSSRLNKLSHHASIQGPIFQQDLPAKVSFSNNSGLVLNCAASGQPVISWQTETGISVLSPSQSIDSLNLLNDNANNKYVNLPLVHQNPTTNALVFRSFASDEFSPEVHSTKYRCLATNVHGTITSSLVQVKAGMLNKFFFFVFIVHIGFIHMYVNMLIEVFKKK